MLLGAPSERASLTLDIKGPAYNFEDPFGRSSSLVLFW